MKVPVDEAPAGPAMDAAVAEALGWHLSDDKGWWVIGPENDYRIMQPAKNSPWDYQVAWSPSTDIAAAEILWDKLAEDHWVVSVCYGPGRDGRNYASVQMQLDKFLAIDLMTRNPRDMNAKAETKPHVICRVFLKARGVTYVEIPEQEEL